MLGIPPFMGDVVLIRGSSLMSTQMRSSSGCIGPPAALSVSGRLSVTTHTPSSSMSTLRYWWPC